MLYNGIGLLSAKGSSTSGRVEKNLSALDSIIKNRNSTRRHSRAQERKDYERESTNITKYRQKMADESLKDHKNKRTVELKCAERRIELEDAGLSDKDIEEQVRTYRVLLCERYPLSQQSCDDEVTSRTERQKASELSAISSTNYVPRHTEGRIKRR